MNLDEAMEAAKAYLVAHEQMQEPLFESEEVAVTLAREVEQLRAEVQRLDMAGTHSCHDDCQRLPCAQRREIERLRSELAAAKAASVCPVNLSWCFESNECDIVITGMSDEDSTKFGNWLNQRIMDTATPAT